MELVQEDEEGQWYPEDIVLIFVDCLDHLTTKIQGSVTHLREFIASTSSAIGSNINPTFANVQEAALTPQPGGGVAMPDITDVLDTTSSLAHVYTCLAEKLRRRKRAVNAEQARKQHAAERATERTRATDVARSARAGGADSSGGGTDVAPGDLEQPEQPPAAAGGAAAAGAAAAAPAPAAVAAAAAASASKQAGGGTQKIHTAAAAARLALNASRRRMGRAAGKPWLEHKLHHGLATPKDQAEASTRASSTRKACAPEGARRWPTQASPNTRSSGAAAGRPPALSGLRTNFDKTRSKNP